MTSVKRTQRKYVQKSYVVRNWKEYETGLRNCESLTIWLSLTDGKLAKWNERDPMQQAQPVPAGDQHRRPSLRATSTSPRPGHFSLRGWWRRRAGAVTIGPSVARS